MANAYKIVVDLSTKRTLTDLDETRTTRIVINRSVVILLIV